MNKINTLINRIKNNEYKLIIRSILLRIIPASLDDILPIPQSYSFFLVGTHGVGYHSLLYYISKCTTPPYIKKHNNILPLTLIALHKEYLDNKRALRIYWELFRGYGYGAWGVTLDGYNKDIQEYLNRHFKKQAPAICLVRDPILAIVSAINHTIYTNITKNKINDLKDCINIINDDRFMFSVIGFTSNVNMIKDKITDIKFIDTAMLKGEIAKSTMHDIAKHINIKASDDNAVYINVNDIFTRSFPHLFYIDGIEFMVSPFDDDFSVFDIQKNIYNKLDSRFYITKNYISKKFKNRKLNISSKEKIQINDNLLNEINKKVEQYLYEVIKIENIYNKYKIDIEILFRYFKHNPNVYKKIKSFLEHETSIIKEKSSHIFQNWLEYKKFLEIES
ncbi:DUF2972 domain-containing protein [Helicobacter sp. MIT 99-5507]|uniref:DUF2972 domain-containing protein n=1 Tax=Helicobacter sp. MIT 99-5507 TaxID=152489 RepID=UPI0015F14422|nr:DUF2972 domain-containing protein [Helicobacter sp. MIT 99-5507]